MNQTIVACVLQKLEHEVSTELLEKVKPWFLAEEVVVVERGSGYTILLSGNERVCVMLDNSDREEILEAKLTLTGLCPRSTLSYYSSNGAAQSEEWIANLAGIAEFRCDVEAGTYGVILCTKDNTFFTR